MCPFNIYNVEGTHPLIWQKFPIIWQQGILASLSPMLCQWGHRNFMQVIAICSVQVTAGRRISFEGLAFASKAIL